MRLCMCASVYMCVYVHPHPHPQPQWPTVNPSRTPPSPNQPRRPAPAPARQPVDSRTIKVEQAAAPRRGKLSEAQLSSPDGLRASWRRAGGGAGFSRIAGREAGPVGREKHCVELTAATLLVAEMAPTARVLCRRAFRNILIGIWMCLERKGRQLQLACNCVERRVDGGRRWWLRSL